MTTPRHAQRLINIAIVLGSLTPYLEWGGGNSAFLAHLEYTVLFGRTTSSDALLATRRRHQGAGVHRRC
ncbi:hypothetical protein BH24ACI4_BH24ACI4_21510 [soil metagenome]